jgi:hypothetical protein
VLRRIAEEPPVQICRGAETDILPADLRRDRSPEGVAEYAGSVGIKTMREAVAGIAMIQSGQSIEDCDGVFGPSAHALVTATQGFLESCF